MISASHAIRRTVFVQIPYRGTASITEHRTLIDLISKDGPPSEIETRRVSDRLGLHGRPYVAFLGVLERRKNVPDLVRGESLNVGVVVYCRPLRYLGQNSIVIYLAFRVASVLRLVVLPCVAALLLTALLQPLLSRSRVAALKKQKLRIKDELERLRATVN